MQIHLKQKQGVLFVLFILFLIAWRVILNIFPAFSGVANFSAGGAIAVFTGSAKKPVLLKILSLFAFLWISDLFIDRFVFGEWKLFYPGFYWVYGAFFCMLPVGLMLQKKASPAGILFAAIICTVIHWVISDWGIFINSHAYPKPVTGWLQIMTAAIPFEFNFLAGTVFYSLLFFGVQWLIIRNTRKHPIPSYSTTRHIPVAEKTKS